MEKRCVTQVGPRKKERERERKSREILKENREIIIAFTRRYEDQKRSQELID